MGSSAGSSAAGFLERGCRRDAEGGLLRSEGVSGTSVFLMMLAPHCRNWSNWLFCLSSPALHLWHENKRRRCSLHDFE